ncbi:MAG: HEPN domain-containing protein [Candidatus Methanoperedens sp.]|nr:HEPN domain-containing protein [Candidatus Methanoperedens sp.]
MFDKDEFERWMAQASNTLNSARQDHSSKSYNWCCFKARQAAEYAVKALLKGPGVSAYGNSIVQLLKDLETCTVLIMGILIFRINKTFDSIDTDMLKNLIG